jgi:hypothetical protein
MRGREDINKLVGRIEKGAEQLAYERDNAAAVLADRGYPNEDAQAWAERKDKAHQAAIDYAGRLRARAATMDDFDRVQQYEIDEAERVAKAAEMGGILIDGRPAAANSAERNKIWDDGAEQAQLDAGTHESQVKAAEIKRTGAFRHVDETIDGVKQVPFWELGRDQGQDATTPVEQAAAEATEGPDPTWTTPEVKEVDQGYWSNRAMEHAAEADRLNREADATEDADDALQLHLAAIDEANLVRACERNAQQYDDAEFDKTLAVHEEQVMDRHTDGVPAVTYYAEDDQTADRDAAGMAEMEWANNAERAQAARTKAAEAGDAGHFEMKDLWTAQADAYDRLNSPEIDINDSPTNDQMNWTTEQEERASGLPSAQAADYTEEPVESDFDWTAGDFGKEITQTYHQAGEAWAAETSYDDEPWTTQPEQQHQNGDWGLDDGWPHPTDSTFTVEQDGQVQGPSEAEAYTSAVDSAGMTSGAVQE